MNKVTYNSKQLIYSRQSKKNLSEVLTRLAELTTHNGPKDTTSCTAVFPADISGIPS